SPERRPGVRRIAVVPEARDRLEPLVAKVGVVLAQDLRGTHHLVDARLRREGRKVDAELLLELDHQVEDDPVDPVGVGDEAPDLPEVRLLLPGGGTERLRLGYADALREHADAAAPE